MSYEIYYKRAFIKVGDDAYIPVAQSGSNNCFSFDSRGHQVPEKNWNCLNYPNRGKFIFTSEELKAWAKVYDAYGEHHKSRHVYFKDGEMARWLINGMKSALPLEAYLQHGNSFYVMDWSIWEDKKYFYPTTTEELLQVIEDHKGVNDLSFNFGGRELYQPKKLKTEKPKEKVSSFYVLNNPDTGNLYKLTRRGYRYSSENTCGKKFKNQKAATAYLKKYSDKLTGFSVQEIQKEAYL